LPNCQYCGTPLAEGASFCSNCGKPTGSPSTIQASAAAGGGGGGSLLAANDLVLKKKILSVHEHYDIEDVNGTKLGEANGNLIQLPAKFDVMDASGAQVMRLEGKVISLRKQFTFYDGAGQELGTIKKKIVKLIGEEYWVEKDGVEFMRIYGNFTEHDYQMTVNGAQVGLVHKRWFTIRDQLGISITGDVDHRVVIGAVIMIEHVEVTERNSGSR
jgi:uncharacterized protein YxjI